MTGATAIERLFWKVAVLGQMEDLKEQIKTIGEWIEHWNTTDKFYHGMMPKDAYLIVKEMKDVYMFPASCDCKADLPRAHQHYVIKCRVTSDALRKRIGRKRTPDKNMRHKQIKSKQHLLETFLYILSKKSDKIHKHINFKPFQVTCKEVIRHELMDPAMKQDFANYVKSCAKKIAVVKPKDHVDENAIVNPREHCKF
jgi:hypothetical protein